MTHSIGIGNASVSVEFEGYYPEEDKRGYRDQYRLTVTVDSDRTYESLDLFGGVGIETTEPEMLSAALEFLYAAAESYSYSGVNGENCAGYPVWLLQWASDYSDTLAYESEELSHYVD